MLPSTDSSENIELTIGATFIGTILAAILYGATCMQCYLYYTVHLQDPLYLKLLIAAVMLTDTIHQALITHSVYLYTVVYYDNPLYLNQLVWSIVAEVIASGTTAVLVQSFFIMRIWKLSRGSVALLVLTSLSVAAQFSLHIAYVVEGMPIRLLVDLAKIKGISIGINGITAFTDVLITVCLVFLLRRSRTSFGRTNSIITRLIIYTVNTGLITSIDAILSLVTILAKPDALIYVAFYYMICRLYSNTLLATLNCRTALRTVAESGPSPQSSTVVLSSLQWRHGTTTTTGGTSTTQAATAKTGCTGSEILEPPIPITGSLQDLTASQDIMSHREVDTEEVVRYRESLVSTERVFGIAV